MSRADGPYRHLLYAGGWLLAPERVRRGWSSVALGPYTLSFAPGSPVARSGDMVVLGRPVHPQAGTAGAEAAVSALSAASEAGRFVDVLDELAGRFVVFVEDVDGPHIYQDAAGTRPVFYRPPIAASHSALANGDPEALDPDVMTLWKRATRTGQGVKYLPGIRAPHRDVRMLTPNTSLHVPTGRIERFWPRDPRHETGDLDRLAAGVADLMTKSVELATRRWHLAMSLTAGIDSRLTLAACREIVDGLACFSYVNPDNPNPTHQVDLDVARDMAAHLGLSHRTYPLGEPAKGDGYAEFRRIWLTNLGIPRGIPTLIKGYVDAWPSGTLHLRSNVAEVGRVFYKGERLDRVTPDALTYWWNPALHDDPDCVAMFAEFCDVTGFTDEAMAGYDPLDIFYWEHRMGSWHAWLCLEADVAHDTFPVYSNRRLLETMLAAPFDARLDATVFHRAIDEMWPRLADWPINPERWPPASQPGGGG